MTDLDPELAAVLRASAEARIRQQIADAARRRQNTADTRAEFQVRRGAGKRQLHAARRNLITRHQKGQQP